MKLITRDTDYAIRALCYSVLCKDKKVSVRGIVKELDVPRPFMRKILQALNKEGILKSYKGKGGGFELSRLPGDIILLDLMKIFQGPFKLNECRLKNKKCPRIKKCLLNKKIKKIEGHIIKELKKITIGSLIPGSKGKYVKAKNNKN